MDFIDFLFEMWAAFLLAVGVVVGVVVLGIWMSSMSCHAKAAALGLESEFGFFIGCIVEDDGQKYQLRNRRDFYQRGR